MKLAALPCSFKCLNKDNPTGSDKKQWFVSSFSFDSGEGPASGVLSGNLCVDSIVSEASVEVVDPIATWTGSATFSFPARHWAFVLDGHATLAVGDSVTQNVELTAVVAGLPVKASFAITAEIESSAQDVYDDWSEP
jgi:hypothetical protein